MEPRDATTYGCHGGRQSWPSDMLVSSPAEFILIHLFYWSILENVQQLWGKFMILQFRFLFTHFSWLPLKVALVCNVRYDKNSKKNIL